MVIAIARVLAVVVLAALPWASAESVAGPALGLEPAAGAQGPEVAQGPELSPLEVWRKPTASDLVIGLAARYDPGVMAQVARNRGLSLEGYRGGVAMLRRGDLGRRVWIRIGESFEWLGPFVVVDCSNRRNYEDLVSMGRVIELSAAEWFALELPDRPVPVVVTFSRPWASRPGGRARPAVLWY